MKKFREIKEPGLKPTETLQNPTYQTQTSRSLEELRFEPLPLEPDDDYILTPAPSATSLEALNDQELVPEYDLFGLPTSAVEASGQTPYFSEESDYRRGNLEDLRHAQLEVNEQDNQISFDFDEEKV